MHPILYLKIELFYIPYNSIYVYIHIYKYIYVSDNSHIYIQTNMITKHLGDREE